MGPNDPLGVTFLPVAGMEAVPVYEAEGGTPVFITDEPYLASDGLSLMAPLYVVDAGGPTWMDMEGQLMSSMPVSGLTPPEPEENAVTVDGIPVTHNGETVTNA